MLDLSGKVFVVTGGNGGIGLALAEGIAEAGGTLAIWGRNDAKNEQAIEGLNKMGANAKSFACDVTNESMVIHCMQDTLGEFGRIDGVVANAGNSSINESFIDTSFEEWRNTISTNLDSVFLTFREATRILIEQGEGGSLVAVSSTSAIHGAARNEAYGAAKTGVNGLVRALAVGLARYGIRVNSLLPGWTITDLVQDSYQNDRFRQVTTQRTPVRRWAEPMEFREIGAFLADPSITFHTGQEVVVDGGYTVF